MAVINCVHLENKNMSSSSTRATSLSPLRETTQLRKMKVVDLKKYAARRGVNFKAHTTKGELINLIEGRPSVSDVDCEEVRRDPSVNPITKKNLSPNSKVLRHLKQECGDLPPPKAVGGGGKRPPRVKKTPSELTAADCDKFLANPGRNPQTNRAISPTGPTAKRLAAKCGTPTTAAVNAVLSSKNLLPTQKRKTAVAAKPRASATTAATAASSPSKKQYKSKEFIDTDDDDDDSEPQPHRSESSTKSKDRDREIRGRGRSVNRGSPPKVQHRSRSRTRKDNANSRRNSPRSPTRSRSPPPKRSDSKKTSVNRERSISKSRSVPRPRSRSASRTPSSSSSDDEYESDDSLSSRQSLFRVEARRPPEGARNLFETKESTAVEQESESLINKPKTRSPVVEDQFAVLRKSLQESREMEVDDLSSQSENDEYDYVRDRPLRIRSQLVIPSDLNAKVVVGNIAFLLRHDGVLGMRRMDTVKRMYRNTPVLTEGDIKPHQSKFVDPDWTPPAYNPLIVGRSDRETIVEEVLEMYPSLENIVPFMDIDRLAAVILGVRTAEFFFVEMQEIAKYIGDPKAYEESMTDGAVFDYVRSSADIYVALDKDMQDQRLLATANVNKDMCPDFIANPHVNPVDGKHLQTGSKNWRAWVKECGDPNLLKLSESEMGVFNDGWCQSWHRKPSYDPRRYSKVRLRYMDKDYAFLAATCGTSDINQDAVDLMKKAGGFKKPSREYVRLRSGIPETWPTFSQCREFARNSDIDPMTGRRLAQSSSRRAALEKACALLEGNDISGGERLKRRLLDADRARVADFGGIVDEDYDREVKRSTKLNKTAAGTESRDLFDTPPSYVGENIKGTLSYNRSMEGCLKYDRLKHIKSKNRKRLVKKFLDSEVPVLDSTLARIPDNDLMEKIRAARLGSNISLRDDVSPAVIPASEREVDVIEASVFAGHVSDEHPKVYPRVESVLKRTLTKRRSRRD